MSDESTHDHDVAYYGAIVNAWVATRMERDKSILTLSGGAIGLLITLLTTGEKISSSSIVLFVAATLSFVISLVTVIAVFQQNSCYLEGVVRKERTVCPVLSVLDHVASVSFVVGVVLAMVLGIVKGLEILNRGA